MPNNAGVMKRIAKELDQLREEVWKNNKLPHLTDADKEIAKVFKKIKGRRVSLLDELKF